jgi:hypothetical protein
METSSSFCKVSAGCREPVRLVHREIARDAGCDDLAAQLDSAQAQRSRAHRPAVCFEDPTLSVSGGVVAKMPIEFLFKPIDIAKVPTPDRKDQVPVSFDVRRQ